MRFPNWNYRYRSEEILSEEKKPFEKMLFEADDFHEYKDFLIEDGFVPGSLEVGKISYRGKGPRYRVKMNMISDDGRDAYITLHPDGELTAEIRNDFGKSEINSVKRGDDGSLEKFFEEPMETTSLDVDEEVDLEEALTHLGDDENLDAAREYLGQHGFNLSEGRAVKKDLGRYELLLDYERDDGAEARLEFFKNRMRDGVAGITVWPPDEGVPIYPDVRNGKVIEKF